MTYTSHSGQAAVRTFGEAELPIELSAFEYMVRTGKDMFLRSNHGRVPKRLMSGEDVCELSIIAEKVGLAANYQTIRIIAEFCGITNPAGERLFLDTQYEAMYPPQPDEYSSAQAA